MSGGSYVRRKQRPVDNYTQVSNALIRDRRITPKAKGVAAWLLSHSTEYRFTTDAIAEHLGVGVDQIKTAIRELEKHGYLERVFLREPGTARVTGMEYLLDDNPTPAAVHANPQVSADSGFPADGEPAGGSAADGLATDGKPGGHIEDEVPRTSSEEDQSCMHDDFWAAMTRLVSTPIDRGGRNFVHDHLAHAFAAGWSPDGLARWVGQQLTGARGVSNPAGFVITQLRGVPDPADVPPPPQVVDEQRVHAARLRAADRARERANCSMCDADGYVGLRPCDHDPGQAERNRQGAARARAALATRRGTAGSGPPAPPQEPEQDERAVP